MERRQDVESLIKNVVPKFVGTFSIKSHAKESETKFFLLKKLFRGFVSDVHAKFKYFLATKMRIKINMGTAGGRIQDLVGRGGGVQIVE